MVLSLNDFVLTGKLGDISIGSSKTEVLNFLGEPEKIRDHKNGTGALIYNGFCFFYSVSTEIIYAVLCQNFDDSFKERPATTVFKISENKHFDTQFFAISEDTNYKKVIDHLKTEQIIHREESHKFWDRIICESGVEFLFNNWLEYPEDEDYNREELILCGFRNFPVKSV